MQSCEVCKNDLHEGKIDRSLSNGESKIKGEECDVQKPQMNETSQGSERTEYLTPVTSEGQDIMFSATLMVKVGACQTFQENDYSRKHKDMLQERMCMTSYVKETVDNVTSANVSNIRIEQNGNETWMERRPTEECRKIVEGKVSFCNILDGCRTNADVFQRNDGMIRIFSFMAMMVMMMMASCIGHWTCTLGEIFRKGTECCSKRIRGWLLTGCFIEWCGISIVLLYMTDNLPIYKFSETVIQIMWTYVVM